MARHAERAPLVLNPAAAEYHLGAIADLMDSIAALQWADADHRVKRVEGWGHDERIVCTCGDWPDNMLTHVHAMAKGYLT